MECYRCGNEERKYFYEDGDIWYCRKCVHFGRIDVGERPIKKQYRSKVHQVQYQLDYELTKHQKEVVLSLNKRLKEKKNVLIYAACGAGKTEIVMESIQLYLNKGKKVGMAIARRQVVLEIQERMQSAFRDLRVIAVCEGYTHVVDGDFIICTMHQLYRYYHTFDLLVMDEIDAFPYADNAMLECIAKDACIGEAIYLSATPSTEMRQAVKRGEITMLELFVRPHGFPLIEPKLIYTLPKMEYLILFFLLLRYRHKQVLLFVPTIATSHQLHFFLRAFMKCKAFTSQTKEKEKIIQEFREKQYQCLVCTTVLERGITLDGIDVIIFQADHSIFNQASLIQMIGRVGRKKEHPFGDALLLYHRKTKAIKQCCQTLKRMNEDVL